MKNQGWQCFGSCCMSMAYIAALLFAARVILLIF